MSFQFSACDLLSEARYASMMQSHPELGPDLMTFVWFGLQAASLVATIIVGPLIKYLGVRAVYLAALTPMALIILPAAKNYLEEVPRSLDELMVARRKLTEQREAMALCILMFISTVIMTLLGIFFRSTIFSVAFEFDSNCQALGGLAVRVEFKCFVSVPFSIVLGVIFHCFRHDF